MDMGVKTTLEKKLSRWRK